MPSSRFPSSCFPVTPRPPIEVPRGFLDAYALHGPEARKWLAGLPRLGAEFLDRWRLRPDGPAGHGTASLVLPVVREDGLRAALKLQQPREENAGTAAGLLAWRGDGVVRLLDHDTATATQLLERLDPSRTPAALDDDDTAMEVLAGLLARLTSVAAPPGLRTLAATARAMLEQTPRAVPALAEPGERRLIEVCAASVADVAGESGDRLLHWDLHYGNVLAGEREPWLAIDPEPLAGDPGFDLLPALDSAWEKVVASPHGVTGAVLRRFDLLTAALGLERDRAVAWTLGRVLQNALWDIEDGRNALEPAQVAIATALLEHRRIRRTR
ncbi:aminoglycoside phosphotransferase family protein [Streptomyces yaizuensis]|uniref:Hydroxyurea phosphotransferase n=1 Tax=Streptomyces yaizuensis TaxID=2989713 RepID=A0ABQ5NXB6_9ACTN|nr:hydroxyurea phosphotransferase [Streptomyces sp. YSPA8]